MKDDPKAAKLGEQIEPPDNPGAFIGKFWRAKICARLTTLLNWRFIFTQADSNGNPLAPVSAEVTIGSKGCTVIVPVLAAAGSGGGGGSSGITGAQQFKIVSDGGDYWLAKTWDGTTLGTIPQIIWKPYKLRAGSTSIGMESIRSVLYTYLYSAVTVGAVTGYYTRSVSGSDGSSELNLMIPDPIASDIIYAIPCTTIIDGAHVGVLSATLNNPGTGGTYAVNNILSISGGTGTPATIKVLSVTAGRITTYALLTIGDYSNAPPTLTANPVTGGGGSGATFDIVMATPLIDLNVDARAWAT